MQLWRWVSEVLLGEIVQWLLYLGQSVHELKENGNTSIVLAQWFLINGVFLTFGVSCRENLLGQIPRNCVSMVFLCSKPLERTKLSGVQNHSPNLVAFSGWLATIRNGGYVKRSRNNGQKFSPCQVWILEEKGLFNLEVALGTLNVYHVWFKCGLADPIQERGDFFAARTGHFFLQKNRAWHFWVTFEPLRGHFAKAGKVTSKSLLSHFNDLVLWLSGISQQ